MRSKTMGCHRFAPFFSRHRLLPTALRVPLSQHGTRPEELQYGQQPFGRWCASASPSLQGSVRQKAYLRERRSRHVPRLPHTCLGLPSSAFLRSPPALLIPLLRTPSPCCGRGVLRLPFCLAPCPFPPLCLRFPPPAQCPFLPPAPPLRCTMGEP